MKNNKNQAIILTLIALTFGSIQMSFGQAAIVALLFGDKVATENLNIGLELGGNLPTIKGFNSDSKTTPSVGTNFGISVNMKLNEHWFFSPTAYFISDRSFKFTNYSSYTGNPSIDDNFVNVDGSANLNYIDIPLLVSYQYKKVRFSLGPQISILTKSSISFNGSQGQFTQDIKKETNSMDYGVLSSVAYELGHARKGKGIFVALRYYQGFNDIYNSSHNPGNNTQSYLSLHVSLPFVTDEIANNNLKKLKELEN